MGTTRSLVSAAALLLLVGCGGGPKPAEEAPCNCPEGEKSGAPCDHAKKENAEAPCDHAKKENAEAPCDHAKKKDAEAPCDHAKKDNAEAPCDHAKKKHHAHAGHHGKGHHHSFADAEKWSKMWDTPERDAWQKPDAVVAAIGLAPNAVVADVGAGTGYFSMRLAKAVPQGKVLATDAEPDMVEFLKNRAAKEGLANVTPVKADPVDPTLPEKADVVFLCNVYHHIDARTAWFGKLKASLKPGGKLVIVDYRPEWEGHGPPKHARVTPDQIAAELKPAGWVEASRETKLLERQYVITLTVAAATPAP